MLTGQAPGQTMYKVPRNIDAPNYFTEFPCGVCPVMMHCCDDGIISPKTCEYMRQWLQMPDTDIEDYYK